MLYALEREPFPTLSWVGARRAHFAFVWTKICSLARRIIKKSWWWTTQSLLRRSSMSPFGAGIRLSIGLDDARRVDPAGVPYRPFHDVPGGDRRSRPRALAELARERWTRGAYERAPPVRSVGDPWPASMTPDFAEIDVGIAAYRARFRRTPRSASRGTVLRRRRSCHPHHLHRKPVPDRGSPRPTPRSAHAGAARARGRPGGAQGSRFMARGAHHAGRTRPVHAAYRGCRRAKRAALLCPARDRRRPQY